MKASEPTVTGCMSAEPSTSAKMKLFQAKMNESRPAAAMPGRASGMAIFHMLLNQEWPSSR